MSWNRLLLLLALAAAPAAADDGRDRVLRFFYGGKVGISALALATAITEPEGSSFERLVVGGSSALVGMTSGLVLFHSRRDNGTALRRWRTAALVVDAALTALAAGAAIHRWSDPDSTISDQYAGLGFAVLAGVGLVVSAADLVPFEAEER